MRYEVVYYTLVEPRNGEGFDQKKHTRTFRFYTDAKAFAKRIAKNIEVVDVSNVKRVNV